MEYMGISRGPLTEEQIKASEQFEKDYETGYPYFGPPQIRCRECHSLWPGDHADGCKTGECDGEAKAR